MTAILVILPVFLFEVQLPVHVPDTTNIHCNFFGGKMGLHELFGRLASVDRLTPSEVKLAKYFESNYQSLVFENIETLSQKAGVGTSTLSRFINKLGYSNFREFLYSLRESAVCKTLPADVQFPARPQDALTPEELLELHVNNVSTALVQSLSLIKMEYFKKAVDLLCDVDRTVFTVGVSTSAGFLTDAGSHFSYVRANCFSLRDNHELASHLTCMPADAVLFAVGIGPYEERTRNILKYFYKSGHETILITDSYVSPDLALATVPLVVQVYPSGFFQTFCPVLAVLEALLKAVAVRSGLNRVRKDSPLFDLLNTIKKM